MKITANKGHRTNHFMGAGGTGPVNSSVNRKSVSMNQEQLKYSHPGCYASCLSNCSRKLSREHFLTHGILRSIALPNKGNININGMLWQSKSEKKELPPNAIAGKILCDKHNQEMSLLDNVAIELFKAIDEVEHFTPSQMQPLELNGHDIERWMLKTLCGFLYSGILDLKRMNYLEKWVPPRYWIDLLFVNELFPPGIGLYFYGEGPRGTVQPPKKRGVSFRPLLDKHIGIYGAILAINIPSFIIALAFPPSNINGTLLEHSVYRPSKLVLTNKSARREVNLKWNDQLNHRVINIRYNVKG